MILSPIAFTLTEDEKNTPLWLRLRTHLSDKLDGARARNDRALSETETATIRGEIACLKKLIALEDVRPFVPGEQDAP